MTYVDAHLWMRLGELLGYAGLGVGCGSGSGSALWTDDPGIGHERAEGLTAEHVAGDALVTAPQQPLNGGVAVVKERRLLKGAVERDVRP